MAAQASFDITSTVERQEVDNAVNQTKKEVGQRYDFKGSTATIDYKRGEDLIDLVAEDTLKLDALWETLQTRMSKRGVPVKNLKPSDVETVAGGLLKRTVTLQQGIPTDTAREIVKCLKDRKLKKVQAAIQGDQIRVSSPSKDDLQAAMQALRGHDFEIDLQFGNYR